MPTPKKKKAPVQEKDLQMPKEQQEAYCNSVMRMVPANELPHPMPPTPDDVMRQDYATINNDIPGLLRAILRELIIMRLSK